MTKKKIRMKEFNPQKEDVILFDTNILIDLFYPMDVGKDVSEVANLYKKIKKSEARVIISAIQISEFVNRCIRFQFELYKQEHPECTNFKKHYRVTEDYSNCMKVIIDIIKNEWQGKFEYVDDKFNEMPFDKILEYKFSYDFNDAIIVEIANKYNAIIVSNDNDIINYDTKNTIVSSNSFLLSIH